MAKVSAMTPIVEKAPNSPATIALAKEFNKAGQKGIKLGLTSDELAFYDAMATSEASVIRELLGLAQRKDNRPAKLSASAHRTLFAYCQRAASFNIRLGVLRFIC